MVGEEPLDQCNLTCLHECAMCYIWILKNAEVNNHNWYLTDGEAQACRMMVPSARLTLVNVMYVSLFLIKKVDRW